EFISQHREEFDEASPSLKAWYQIEKSLEQEVKVGRRIQLWKATRIAAAVILLLVTGGVIGSILTKQSSGNEIAVEQLEKIVPELPEMEQYYGQQLNQKLQQLASYENVAPQILQDLEENDVFIQELKQELLKAPKGTEEIVLNNIIRTYQIKLGILERVLEHLEASKIQKSDRDEVEI
ncbi:MAG: hypothetical protein AAFO82_11015, partial [Bacteroidota bacterium]